MRSFELILRFPGGGPLIGGHTGHATGAHVVHAMDHAGQPVIPSTAIRGALRESLEALLRGTGQKACMGGDGREPLPASTTSSPPTVREACTLDHGTRCAPCRLFGSSRKGLDRDETAFSGLVLGPARLPEQPEDPGRSTWHTRPGVAIDRKHRSAHAQALVFQRMPTGRELCFVAHGRLRVPELSALLEAAVRTTKHIGAGRSRGPGHVEMTLRWHDQPSVSAISLPEGDVYVRMVLETPASFGVAVVERNFRDTRQVVPGSAVRGAVGFALAEMIADVNNDSAFQTLIDPERGAQFGFLHPVDVDAAPGEITSVLPITAQACKREGRDHGIVDVLLDRLVLALADSAERFERAQASAMNQCASCQSPLRSSSGSRRARTRPRIRAVTRVSMDRTRSSARNEYLFTEMLIEAGTHFEGTIRNVPAAGRERLAQALGSGLMSLGRGRAMGWGQVSIEASKVAPAVPRQPVAGRGADFEHALGERLRKVGVDESWAQRLVPVTLLSPLIPLRAGDDEDGEHLLVAALGGHGCRLKIRRFAREGVWDQKIGQMDACWAVAAGGVFVIELGEGTSWRDVVSRIEQVEQHGVGARRHQGFGQVLCFDPFFLTGQPAPEHHDLGQPAQEYQNMSMDASQRLRPYRKELVLAAERVMEGITDGISTGKTQLNRLVSVCNEASCAEEIENYLRYQAGRSSGEKNFWNVGLVKKTIDEITSVLGKATATSDTDRVAAWRLYAVYMTRAFTYQAASKGNRSAQDANRSRR